MFLSESYFLNKIKSLDLKENYWFEVRMPVSIIGGINFKSAGSFETQFWQIMPIGNSFPFLATILLKRKWDNYFIDGPLGYQTTLLLYPFLLGFVFFSLFLPFLSYLPYSWYSFFCAKNSDALCFHSTIRSFYMTSGWVSFGYVLREDDKIFYILQANERGMRVWMSIKLINN